MVSTAPRGEAEKERHLRFANQAQLHANHQPVVAHPVPHVLEELVKALQTALRCVG